MSGFKRKLAEDGNSAWADEEARKSNVGLTRPSHDAWGIKKVRGPQTVTLGDCAPRPFGEEASLPPPRLWTYHQIVFVYCDDFLLRCFEMPWFHDPAWRDLLLPVFEALGVPPNKVRLPLSSIRRCGRCAERLHPGTVPQPPPSPTPTHRLTPTRHPSAPQVVRCLLASMPPGVAIPPHHDTGYWVNYTHRIHLPIITDPDHVAFRVGPNVEQMARFDFAEGCLVELNNQVGWAGLAVWCGGVGRASPPRLDEYPAAPLEWAIAPHHLWPPNG